MAAPDLKGLEAILGRYGQDPAALLPILEETQRSFGYLSEKAMEKIADALGLPLSKVFGVATFYSLFTTKEKGKHIIRICESTPCHLGGMAAIRQALQKELGVEPGQTTEDGLFTLEYTSCLGACAEAPAIMVDDIIYSRLTPAKVAEIIAACRKSAPKGAH